MTTKKKYHHGSLKSALIQAVLDLMESQTYESLSLRKIAARIGVNQTALYSHFKNKNALLAELTKHGFQQLIDESNTVLNQANNAEENLSLFVRYYLQFATQNPELFKLMFGPTFSHLHPDNPDLWTVSEDSFTLYQKVIEDYLASINSPTPSHLVSLTVWSFMHGFGYLIIGDRLSEDTLNALENDLLLEQLLDIIKLGLNHPLNQ